MSHQAFQTFRPLHLVLALAACTAPLAASAATAAATATATAPATAPATSPAGASGQAERRAIYERDRAACESGKSTQERSLCLHDVTVAYRMPHTNKPYDLDPAVYQRNQALRCGPLKDKDLQDCIARMRGAGTTSGSVETGGMLRELTTIEVGPVDSDTKPATKSTDKP